MLTVHFFLKKEKEKSRVLGNLSAPGRELPEWPGLCQEILKMLLLSK
jgi:hypothetical protein